VTGIDRGGSGEVGGDSLGAKEHMVDEHSRAGNKKPREDYCGYGREPVARDTRNHCVPPIRPPNVQPGHSGIPLYGKGTSDLGRGDGKPGPRAVSKVRNPHKYSMNGPKICGTDRFG